MNNISSRRQVLGFMVGAAAVPGSLWAQVGGVYPSKPVKFIVPFAPGGTANLLARLIATEFFADAKQPITVENVPGAGGNIGAALVARAPADGYTLEVGVMSTHAMNGSLYVNLPFDPVGDFQPVGMLGYAINVIAVSAKLPVKTFPELLAYIRANPGKVNYASGGVGTHNHLALALLAKTANLDIVHVPYKGGGPAVAALVKGECDMFAGGASLLVPHAKSGAVRLIAVTEPQRYAALPDVPSVSETMPGFTVTNWYGVFAPKALPADILQVLNDELNRVTGLPEIAERFKTLGIVRAPVKPAELQTILDADAKLWADTIVSMSIKAQ